MIIHAGPTCGKTYLFERFEEEGIMDTDLEFETQFPKVWETRLKLPRSAEWRKAVAQIGEDARAWSANGGLVVTNLRDPEFWAHEKPDITVFRQPEGMVNEFERRALETGEPFDRRAWLQRTDTWFSEWCSSIKSGSWRSVPSVVLTEGQFLTEVVKGTIRPRVPKRVAVPSTAFVK